MTEETPIKMLKADHKKVEKLFDECRNINPNEKEEKLDIAHKICKELEIHMEVEEQLFYPEIEKISMEGRDIGAQSRKEHKVVKDIVAQIHGLDVDTYDDDKIQELETNVMTHVKREEEDVFPFAEEKASDALGLGLSAKMLAAKEKIRFTR